MTLYLNGTTGVSGVDGSAGTPSLQGNDTNTGIVFGTDTVGVVTGGVQRTTVDSSGRLLVGVGSANANGGVLQLSGGITFPGTQVAATDVNTLDDYEEGTWTANVNGASGYSSQTGYYTKIGKLVFISLAITFTSSNPGGGAYITGAPFSPANGLQATIAFGRNTYTTGYEPTAFIQYGGGAIYPIVLSTGSSPAPRSGGAEIILSGCYTIP